MMSLPHSMDYLMDGGVLDFDAAAYLNQSPVGMGNYYPPTLNGVRMQQQSYKDSFSSQMKNKLSDTKTIKTIVAAAIVTILAGVGISKSKKACAAIKNSKVVQTLGNACGSVKNWFTELPKKFSKLKPNQK